MLVSRCVWEAQTAHAGVEVACVDVKGCFLSASRLEGGCLTGAAFWVI